MQLLTAIFNNPITPWAIASVLAGGTFVVAFRWWWHGRCLKLQVDQIRSAAGINAAVSIRDDVERWHDFAKEKFETAKEGLALRADGEPLARQTLAYLERSEPVQDQSSDRLRLETAITPTGVIHLSEHLMERGIQVSLFRAFPNYLVGIGLCITFLGLAVVIGNASKVLQKSNVETAAKPEETIRDSQQAKQTPDNESAHSSDKELSELLVAASSKFWSSLTAVLCSILYGIWFRHRSQQMERLVGLLARDLGRCVRVISTDELHYESVRRLRNCEDYQASTAASIGMVVTGLNNNQASNAEQHRILLEKLQAVADALAQKFGELGNDIGKGIAGGVGKELTRGIKESAVHMQAVAEEFKHLTGKVKEQSASIAANFGQASGSAKNIEAHFKELPALTEPLKQASLVLHHGAELVSSNIGKIIQENENVAARWKALADLVAGVDEALGKEIESLNNVFPPYADKLKKFSEEWEETMIKALGGLAANIKDLSGSHEELRIQRMVWHNSAVAVARSVDVVNEHVTRFTKALAAHGEAQKQALQNVAATNDSPPQDTKISEADADKGADSESNSTTIPS